MDHGHETPVAPPTFIVSKPPDRRCASSERAGYRPAQKLKHCCEVGKQALPPVEHVHSCAGGVHTSARGLTSRLAVAAAPW
jgi:hypothetical protein